MMGSACNGTWGIVFLLFLVAVVVSFFVRLGEEMTSQVGYPNRAAGRTAACHFSRWRGGW
jgi:hypothetical protein